MNTDTLRGEVLDVRVLGNAFWGVASVRPLRGAPVSCVGKWPGVSAGDTVELVGCWTEHPKYGRQIKVHEVSILAPVDASGAIAWIASRLPFLGRTRAVRMVEEYGLPGVWEVLEHEPERLVSLGGVTLARAEEIGRVYREHMQTRERLVLLRTWGLTDHQASVVFDKWGVEAEAKLRENPYRLAEEVQGFGFKRADVIAQRMGMPSDAPPRIRAALLHALSEATYSHGHTYVPRGALVRMTATKLLELPEDVVARELAEVLDGVRAIARGSRIYWAGVERAEATVADAVRRMVA